MVIHYAAALYFQPYRDLPWTCWLGSGWPTAHCPGGSSKV